MVNTMNQGGMDFAQNVPDLRTRPFIGNLDGLEQSDGCGVMTPALQKLVASRLNLPTEQGRVPSAYQIRFLVILRLQHNSSIVYA